MKLSHLARRKRLRYQCDCLNKNGIRVPQQHFFK
jgi:hypothetical protein